jgi:hypothetical protein
MYQIIIYKIKKKERYFSKAKLYDIDKKKNSMV